MGIRKMNIQNLKKSFEMNSMPEMLKKMCKMEKMWKKIAKYELGTIYLERKVLQKTERAMKRIKTAKM